MAHVCFHSRKRVHTRLSEKDGTQRLTRRNRSLPSPGHSTVLCCQRNSFCSATLLYTYISRFSVTPHYQQQFYLRPSFITFFNFSHKRPTFAFTSESGYTLGFAQRIAHNGSHAEIGGVSDGGGITTLGPFRTFTNIPGPGVRTANFAAFGSWLGVLPKNAESLRDSDALMRIAVPRRRGPAGLRDLFRFCRNCGLYALCSELSACARRGALSLPSARFACSRNAGRPLVKTTCLPFSEVDGHCSPRNAYFLANIQVFLSAISVANTFALWYDKSQIRIFRR